MADQSYRFFRNEKCEYFPCHQGIPEKDFNCLFCYCPLYCLGTKCGGNFTIMKGGCKDCSNCTIPHDPKSYDTIINRYGEIVEISLRESSLLKPKNT